MGAESAITVQDYWRRQGNLLRRAHRLAVSLFSDATAGLDISRSQFEALIAISRFSELDQISLARAFGIDRSTTAGVLDVLTQRNLVKRAVHPQDRRKRVLELTKAGAAVLAAAGKGARQAERKLLQPLNTEEADFMLATLRKIITTTPSTAPEWTLEASGEVDEAKRTQFGYLSRRPGFLLRRCVQVSSALFGEAAAGLDITPIQYGLMFLLKAVQVDEGTIARVTGVERSTSDRLLQRLKARGYIERAKNREFRVLRLTETGHALFGETHRRAQVAEDRLFASLSAEDRARFIGALVKLLFVHS
ncbi:MAG: MarR family transcriptional regulator [Caulobacteraceae bacterium]